MPHPAAFMHNPSHSLGACILAAVERDTRGCILSDTERLNYYPATPMAVISWIFEGTLHMVEELGPGIKPALSPALPRLIFSGPQRRPSVSWSQGPVHALSVGFYPESIRHLIGRTIEPYLDQTLPLESVAPPAFLRACQAILAAGQDEPFAALEAQIQPLWNEPGRTGLGPYVGDWVRSVATRAAHSTGGLSLRQLQRRFCEWTGQSYRDLQLFTRVEEAFIHRIAAHSSSPRDLCAIAVDAGFADQSHMGREVRRVTGLSPARFGEHLENDEAFWYYRLMASSLKGKRHVC